jgi:hypothetical protein
MWSMKSSRPLSAHCRSSKTRMVVPRAAMRSRKMRQAANRTSRPPTGAGSTPSRVSDPLEYAGVHPLAGGGLVVLLGQAHAPADDLAQSPEGDALAVGGRPAAVPVERLDHPVEVLFELPAQTALADAGGAGDRDQACLRLAAGQRHHLLEQPQLLLAADERRFGQLRTTLAAALSQQPDRAMGGNRSGLALQHLFTGGLELDRRGRGIASRSTHQHGARWRDRLEPGRGVD